MRMTGKPRTLLLLPAAGVLALVVAACGSAAGGPNMETAASHPRRAVVHTTMNRTLDETVLVTGKGMTLYSLSAETHGRFICKNASCFSLWTPLVVPRGVTPTGARLLGTVKRPDGRIQVSYRGRPLYTFNEDRKPGDVKGNGFKDVGTWLAASGNASRPAAPAPAPANPYG
jgi:predicted lipoprotein with Yx(FWY)xxD motif